jgi:uncharacterized membrane protein YkoI
MDPTPSPSEGILDELMRLVGPKVSAATWKKVSRAKAALRQLEAKAEAAYRAEEAKQDYVVTLSHPEHGTVKIARRALTSAEAEAAAAKLAPGYEVVESQIENRPRR